MSRIFSRQRVVVILSLFIAVIAISCVDSIDRSPFKPESIGKDIQDTTINVLRFTGGTVRSSSALVGVQFSNDANQSIDICIYLGTNDSTFVFKDVLNRHPNNFIAKVNNVYELNGLLPNTTYTVMLTREQGLIKLASLATSFTTKGSE